MKPINSTSNKVPLVTFILLIVAFLVACQGTLAESEREVTEDLSGETSETVLDDQTEDVVNKYPSNDSFGPGVLGVRLDPTYRAEVVYQSKVVPSLVRLDSSDQIYVASFLSDTIFRLDPNGELIEHFFRAGWEINDFQFDEIDNMWITNGRNNELVRVDKSGSIESIAASGEIPKFFFDSLGNIVGVNYYGENRTIKVLSPDGNMSTYATNLGVVMHAIGPNDEILILDTEGQLVELLPGGEKRIIASGFPYDSGLAFAPDGTLYVMYFGIIVEVDIETGEVTQQDWLNSYSSLSWEAVFDSAGQMYVYGGNEGLYKIDFENQKVEQSLGTFGNTEALTVDPSGAIYLGYGDGLPEGSTRLYEVQNGSLIEAGVLPGGKAKGLASVDPDVIYIATEDRVIGTSFYEFNLTTGQIELLYRQDGGSPNSLVVDPTTGYIWWSMPDEGIYYLDDAGALTQVSVPIDNPSNMFLDFSLNGGLYAIIWEQRPDGPAAGVHKLYLLEEDGTWTELADMTTEDPGIYLAIPVVCPDGTVYSIASVDGSAISPPRDWASFNAILRLEEDGTMLMLGYDVSIDTKAAYCEPSTGDIVFTHFYGVYRLIREDVP